MTGELQCEMGVLQVCYITLGVGLWGAGGHTSSMLGKSQQSHSLGPHGVLPKGKRKELWGP